MIQILHGENIVASRQRLVEMIEAAKSSRTLIVHLDAKQLTLPEIENALQSQSLFDEKKMVVIEELHSLPKSKKKDELITFVGGQAADVILWEKRALTVPMIKKFPGARVQEFKLTNVLFQWLDALSGKKSEAHMQRTLQLFQKAVVSDGDFMCFTMLIRQIRLLLQIKSGASLTLAPFMLTKLRSQSQTFSLEQLLTIHHRLLEIDIAQKTSTSRLGLVRDLELLLLTM